jgi:hypothetical protein
MNASVRLNLHEEKDIVKIRRVVAGVIIIRTLVSTVVMTISPDCHLYLFIIPRPTSDSYSCKQLQNLTTFVRNIIQHYKPSLPSSNALFGLLDTDTKYRVRSDGRL